MITYNSWSWHIYNEQMQFISTDKLWLYMNGDNTRLHIKYDGYLHMVNTMTWTGKRQFVVGLKQWMTQNTNEMKVRNSVYWARNVLAKDS